MFDLGSLDPQKLLQLAMQYNPAPVLDELAKGPVPPFTSMVMPQAGAPSAPNVQPAFADMLYGGGVGSPQALVETTRGKAGTTAAKGKEGGDKAASLDEKQLAALQAMLPQQEVRYAPPVAPNNLYRPGQMMSLPGQNPLMTQPGLAALLYGRK